MRVLLEVAIRRLEAERAQLRIRAAQIQTQMELLNAEYGNTVRELTTKEGGLIELRKVLEETDGETESNGPDQGV